MSDVINSGTSLHYGNRNEQEGVGSLIVKAAISLAPLLHCGSCNHAGKLPLTFLYLSQSFWVNTIKTKYVACVKDCCAELLWDLTFGGKAAIVEQMKLLPEVIPPLMKNYLSAKPCTAWFHLLFWQREESCCALWCPFS